VLWFDMHVLIAM